MRSAEPTSLGVREAAEAIRKGVLSPVELVEACLARIGALDGDLRAWAHVDAAGALAIAGERESEARAGRLRGPLHGVPVGVKDIFDVAGMPTTGGATVSKIELPPSFQELAAAGLTVLEAEAAAYHERWFAKHADDYGPEMRSLVEAGLRLSATAYVSANRARLAFRGDVMSLLAAHDALLCPTAPAPAPAGLGSTGDGSLCAPWSNAGVPDHIAERRRLVGIAPRHPARPGRRGIEPPARGRRLVRAPARFHSGPGVEAARPCLT